MRKLTLLIVSLLLTFSAAAQTFVKPQVGGLYRIKGSHSTNPWLTATVEGGGIDVAANVAYAGVYEVVMVNDKLNLKVYGQDLYIGTKNNQITLVSDANQTVLEESDNNRTLIKNGGRYLYNNQPDYTREAGNLTAAGADAPKWGFVEYFVTPEAGKFYKIKGDGELPWLTANATNGGNVVVSNDEAYAGVFLKTENGIQAVATGKYLGYAGGKYTYSGTELTIELKNTGDYLANYNNRYAVVSGGNYMFNNNNDGIVHESSQQLQLPRLWAFIEVEAPAATVNGVLYATLEAAAAAVQAGQTLTLWKGTDEEFVLPMGVKLNKNGFTADYVTVAVPVAKVGDVEYATLASAVEAANAGNEIVMLSDAHLTATLTLPAGIKFNGNGKTITADTDANGSLFNIVANGDIEFVGYTKVAAFNAGYNKPTITIGEGACLEMNGSDRMVIGHGATFNITGQIAQGAAKTTDKASLKPSLVMPGASFTGAGVTFNVKNAYITAPSSYCSSSKSASGTFDFNITNSIWESAGKLAFEEQSVNAKVDFALVNSVLTTGSHLVFGTANGEEGVVIDNSYVNKGTSRQLENCGKMTIKNGAVVNGAVATSSNAKNPGTVIVENATYAVTGEFSGSDLGTGTIIVNNSAKFAAGSITKANIVIDATEMNAGELANFTANLSGLTGELSVINNDKLEAKIENGKIVLVEKPVAKIGEQGYATLEAAFAAAAEGATITLLDNASPALTSQRAITKAAIIDLGDKTMTLTEDDLYFGTTTFKNGTIVVDPSVKPSTAVFWMFANQTLTFNNVKLVATGVTGTYLIGLDGNNSDLNLLNGSEILVENTTALDLDIICVNASTGNDIKVENSKVNVTNLDGRVFFRGNYTVKDSEVNLAGITKAGFRIEAGQTLSIEGTSKVNIVGEPRDGGIHLTDLSATYTKAETATVNAILNEVTPVAVIGAQKFATLQAAVNAVKNGETIILQKDCAEAVTFTQTKEVSFVLDGNSKTYTGSINITARAGKDAPSTLVIKNFNFKTDAIAHDFIKSVETNYYPNNITISDCKFEGTAEINTEDYAVVAVRLKSANNIKIENCTGSGLHSFLQNTAGWNMLIDNVDVTNSLSGFAMGTVQGAGIKNCDLTVNKSGIRFDAQLDNNAVITDNKINAFIPVVVRKASVESSLTFNGENTMTATNADGIWCAVGTSEYVANGLMPTAATGKVKVTLNDTGLSAAGVYGDYVPVAKIGDVEYTSLEAAFKAATEGCEIVILENVTVDYAWDARYTGAKFTVPVTIDGNGKTIKFTGAIDDKNWNTVFRFEENATVNNLTVDISEATSVQRVISAKKSLTVDGLTINGAAKYGVIFGEGASAEDLAATEIVVKNSTLTGTRRAVSDNEGGKDVKSVTIKDNNFAANVYVSAKENVTFTGNTVEGAYVDIRSYTAGNKLKVTATDNTLEENTDTKYNVINAGGVVNAEGFNIVAKGNNFNGYTSTTGIWGEVWGNARESFVIKVLDANGNVMGTTSLNNVGGIIDGDVTVSWNLMFDAASNNDEYWTMSWTTAPSISNMPAKVALWVDGVEVSGGDVVLNGPDDLNKIVAAATDAEGRILSCHTSVANAVAANAQHIALLRNTEETIMLPSDVTLDYNGFTANKLTMPEARVNDVDYAKLADAMAAAKAGDVVTVFAGTYTMPSMKAGITIVGQGDVMFEGTLTGTLENLTMKNIHIKGGNAQRWAYAKGNLVFENVTFEATSVYALHFDGIAEGTNLTYKNCTIIGWAAMGGSPASCVFEGCTIKDNGTYGVIRTYFDAEIKDCTFDVANANTEDIYKDGIHAVDGAKVVVDNCTNANGDMKAIVNVGGSSVITVDGKAYKNVAQIGETKYITIEDAIAAWTNNTTLTLLADVTLSDVVKLKSTEHHYLDLATYTMTAASGKNAIEIVAYGTGDAERGALTITADANNPGGINAGSKSIVYYDYSSGQTSGNDRPIIYIKGGVFTGSTSGLGTYGIYTKGTASRKCATLNISGGTFNCSIYGSGKSKLLISGGVFNYSVGSQGDSTALRLISGGTFKSFGFMTADSNNTKFWIGTAMGTSNVGVYVDDNGYIVVGGSVVTEAGETFEASSTNYSGASNLLQYSSAKDNGLYYTAVEEALADNSNKANAVVTVYADEVDMSGINNYKGTIVVPVGQTVTIVNAPATPAFTVKSADGYVIEPNENGAYESIALVAKIGDKVYDKFEDAVAAAQEGETVTVHKAGTYALKVKNNITITGAVAGVEFANIGAFGCNGANVTFNNVTFTYAENSTYKGLQHSGNLVYNNCTINGQVFLYGQSETFNKCVFNTTDSNNYNVWTYGAKEVAFNECTFNCAGKSVLIYHENAAMFNDVAVTNSTFNASQAVDGKAAIEMDASLTAGINLTIDAATTATGFGTGNVSGNYLWNNKKGNNDVANNDITVKVGDTVVLAPIFEAQIGDAQYRFFQDAINAVQNDETITVLRDIATNVEIKEKDNVKVTIDGNGMKMTGTIKVVALSSDNDRRITIKNFKFEDTTSASVDFITSVETNHYPRITVEGCTFTGSGDATDVALRLKSSKNVEIKNCTGTGLHSFLQNTSGWNLTIENVKVTDSKSGLALGTVQGVTVKGCEIAAAGYGIRMDAGYDNNAVIESNTIEAFIPVVVRKATVNSNIAVNGTNNLTATNNDGIWCAIGTSEYEANGQMPTAATGNVVVALNDAALDSKGIYGNALAGQGTAEAPYLINNIGELVLFRNSVNAGETKYSAPGVHVALGADIDMTGINWVGIGTATAEHGFMGNFDGKNFKIKNLTIDNPALDADGYAYAGLFGVTEGTDKDNQNYIKNLIIENVTINTTGKIVAAAIAYPYYTIVDNVKVCGNIAITGGDYTAGVLAYTRRCVNASKLSVEGAEGSTITGAQVVGGVISDIQMNGGLKAEYSNFSAEGVIVSGTKNVGGISGIIATQTLNGATVKNVTLNSDNAGVGIVAGCLGGTSTISNVTYENVTGATALIGNTYDGTAIEAKIDNTYYATFDAALAAEGEATVELFVPVTVATGESRVIELNGKTVIGTDNATGSFALININPEAELTINGEGAIKLTATGNRGWNAYSSVISNQRGKLTVNGGTIEHLGGTDMAYAIDNLTNTGAQNAETVINGGTVKSTYRAIRQFLNSTSAQNVLTVNGGTIEGANKSIWMQGANANANPGALTVAAVAAIKGDVYLTSAAGTAGYPVVVAVAADALKDGAQVLTSNVPADFAVANVNGTWTKVAAAASLNGKGYATLRAAVEAAQNGETVELLANVTLAGGYEDATEGLRIEREITLNGNGHTIDCGTFQKGIRIYNLGTDGDFQVNFNNVEVVNNVADGRCIDTRSHDINLTITDSKLIAQNGNSQPLTIGGSEAIQRVKLDDAIIDAGNSGYGVIAFVPVKQNIYAYDNTKVTGYAAFYLKDHGNANIKLSLGKGTYIGKNIHSGASNAFGTVVLEGDNNVLQILGTNPILKAITEGNASQAVVLVIGANNKVSLESESATIDIEGENAYYGMISAENVGTTTIINKGNTMLPVAEVGGFQFMTIKEAIRYAGNEGTVKAINDCVLKESWTVAAGQNITFDLNGKTVSYTSAVAGEDMITNRGNLTITDSSEAKTGKLAYVNTDNTASNVTVSTISTEAGSTLVVDGGTIENKTVKADGSSIYSFAIDILTNGNLGDVKVTINGGTVYSDYMAIRQFNNGTACKNSLTINGGYIYGAKRAVQVHMDNNAAVTAINGGKVEAGAEGYALCNFAATGNLEVTGGEFIGAVYSACENFISGGIYDAEVYAGYCAEGYMPNKNTNGTYGVVLVADVYASIDGVTYGSLKAAIDAAKAGETITLLQDVKENVTIAKKLTIDGAEKTITGMITTDGKGLNVTIKNVKFDGNNKTINYAMRADDNNNLVVENCSASNYIYGFLYANKANDKIVVKNVTVEGCAEYGAYLVSFNKATFENFEVKGTTKYGIAVANAGARNVTLKNVSFEDAETPLSINETGTGKVTFTFQGVNEMSKAEFYTSEFVKLASAVQVGTKVYGNFAEAFAAAQDGETVKLLSDFNLGLNDVVVNNAGQNVLANVDGKNITFDMNGKKITVNHTSTVAADRIYSVICVEDAAGLTVKGNGSIDVTTGVTDANVMPKVAYMFWKRGTDGYLVIEDGNYHMDNAEDSMVYTNGDDIVTVKGGTFILDAVGTRTNGFPWVFNAAGNNVANVNVTGGTYNYDIRKQFWAQEVKLAEGLTMRNNGDGTWTVVDAIASVIGADAAVKESYGSIQEAIYAAQDGETVKLLADVAYADADALSVEEKPYSTMLYVQGKNITLDMNGKNIDVEYTGSLLYSVVLVSDGAGLTVTGEGSINVRGLKADGTAAKNIAYVFWKRGTTGYLVIENGTFHMNDAADSMVYTNGDEIVTINGGTFILDAVASQTNGFPVIFSTAGNNERQIVVNGGTFNYDINHQIRPFEPYVAPNKAVKKVDDMWTIVPAQAYVTEKLGDWVYEAGEYAHNVGYATVAEAIAATNDLGKTVTIVAGEYTQNLNVNKAITVKGETDEEGNNLVTFNGRLNISADGATVKNLNFTNASGKAAQIGAKNVTIEGCSLVGSNGLYQSYTSGLVTFKNSYIKGGTYGIHFDGNAGGNIVIENCTVIGWTSFAGTIESVAISGTTFGEGNYNQLRFYQNATIENCTFNEKMNIDWKSSNKTGGFTGCSVEGDKELIEILSLSNIVTNNLEVTIDGELVCVAAKVADKYYMSLQAAIDAATEGQTVTVISDIALTEGVTVAADDEIFIDLNGKTVSMEDATAATAALIKNNGTLTIESSVGGGKLSFKTTTPSAANSYASNTISNYGTLTINSGIVENLSTGGACYALDNYAGSTATINGGKLTAEKTAVRVFNWTNGEANAAELNVVGGEINSNDGYGININAGNAPYVALNISGGTITTNDTDYNLAVYVVNKNSAENFTANISGGTFNGNLALNGVTSTTMVKGNVSVSGGTFDGVICYGEPACQFIAGGSYKAEFTEDYLVYGYQLEANAETALYDANWTGRREVVTIVDDGKVLEFANENDITVGTLTYKRRFGTAKNQSFYVPFEVPMSKIKDQFDVYYISNMHAYDDNDDAVIDRMTLEAFKVPANAVLKANYPYIICAKKAGTEMNIVLDEATLYEAEENSIKCSSVFMEFEIMGIYSLRVGPEYEGTYLLSGGEWKSMLADTYLCAFRLGMTITETGDSPYTISPEAMRSIGIRIVGEENEDGTTTIYEVNAENGEGMIFDLSGRRVLETEKGIYIKDGKKVYVK